MNRLKLQDSDPIKDDDGLKLNARVAKNRCVYDNPYKKCEFYVLYGVGVDKLTEIMDKAPEAGIVRKAGSWFYYEKEDGELIIAPEAVVDGKVEKDVPLKFQGKTAFRTFMDENPWLADQLKQELRGKAARGELMPTFQSEEEMKEIAELSEIEKKIAAEMEQHEKEATKKKQDKKAKDEKKSKPDKKEKVKK